MRISDWSSDVCSSDLPRPRSGRDCRAPKYKPPGDFPARPDSGQIRRTAFQAAAACRTISQAGRVRRFSPSRVFSTLGRYFRSEETGQAVRTGGNDIDTDQIADRGIGRSETGRASCRESVVHYVSISVVAIYRKTKI